MAIQLATHVPRTASNDGVVDAARAAIGDALINVIDHVGVARDQPGEPRQLLLGRHRVVPGVERHSHSSAPFFQA